METLLHQTSSFPITGGANEIGGNAKPYYSGLVTAQTKYGRLGIHAFFCIALLFYCHHVNVVLLLGQCITWPMDDIF